MLLDCHVTDPHHFCVCLDDYEPSDAPWSPIYQSQPLDHHIPNHLTRNVTRITDMAACHVRKLLEMCVQ